MLSFFISPNTASTIGTIIAVVAVLLIHMERKDVVNITPSINLLRTENRIIKIIKTNISYTRIRSFELPVGLHCMLGLEPGGAFLSLVRSAQLEGLISYFKDKLYTLSHVWNNFNCKKCQLETLFRSQSVN